MRNVHFFVSSHSHSSSVEKRMLRLNITENRKCGSEIQNKYMLLLLLLMLENCIVLCSQKKKESIARKIRTYTHTLHMCRNGICWLEQWAWKRQTKNLCALCVNSDVCVLYTTVHQNAVKMHAFKRNGSNKEFNLFCINKCQNWSERVPTMCLAGQRKN